MCISRALVFGSVVAAMLCFAGLPASQAQPAQMDGAYYKDFPLFHRYPEEAGRAQWSVFRLGPVGIGVDLTLPAFGMKVRNVEAGSPAAATGKFKAGQIIESINRKTLQDIDPRVILGNIVTQAEATDGVVRFMVKENPNAAAQEVIVNIPVLGAYSKTWPLNCPKSDKVVRGVADYLAKNRFGTFGHDQSLLFLLSTGEEKDLEVARAWVKDIVEKNKSSGMSGMIPWAIGYGAPALCEYYLQTGDESVLPLIKRIADQAARLMYNGGWNHRTVVNFKYGHMNAAGVHVVKFLLLAKECGVDVDAFTLQASLRHFFRFVGRGNVPYGDGVPESGFVDNGKVGGLAFAMAAAAALTPDGENSIYAKARDISAVKGFYSTSWMSHGHTGGGIGEVWRSSAMGLMHGKKPTKYREFMDNRMWHYDLSRRFDGSMAILADTPYSLRYDNEIWGAGYAMTYTIPRKTLRMTGAPPTRFSKPFRLPERPWGTAADDAFYSLVPAADKNGRIQDIDAERLATDASWPILRRLQDTSVTDETLLLYTRHPDYNVRQMAASYIRRHERDHLIMDLLRDNDPRVRHAGMMAICNDTGNRSHIPSGRLTDEMIAKLSHMIADPEESWWTVANAMMALSNTKPEHIAPNLDVILKWLRHEEWWMHRSALAALAPLAADPQYARRVIPAVARLVAQNTVGGAVGSLPSIVKAISSGSPEVQEMGLKAFALAYRVFPTDLRAPGGADMRNALPHLQGALANAVVSFPGGFDVLYSISQEIMPDLALPYQNLYFRADTAKFGPELAAALPGIIRDEVIPEYIGNNLNAVLADGRWLSDLGRTGPGKDFAFAVTSLDGLVSLYRQAGTRDYDWRTWGPERNQIEWDYFSFDLDKPMDSRMSSKAYCDAIVHARGAAARAAGGVRQAAAAVARREEPARNAQNALNENSSDRDRVHAARLQRELESFQERLAAAEMELERQTQVRDQAMLAGRLPAEVANWYSPDFNPVQAGWRKGLAPFANNRGELKVANWNCRNAFCGCNRPPNTLWEKEVLLMRATLEVPPLKEDHRYRILLGGNIFSRQGGPVTIYVNGRPVHQLGGFGPRTRPRPRGILIDKAMAKEFRSGRVLIGVAAVRPERAHLSLWLEEMKIPPLEDRDIQAARMRISMLSAEWQELQDPEEKPEDPNEGKYRYAGRFVDNPRLRGTWKVIAEVATMEDFTGEVEGGVVEAPFATLSLLAEGKTQDASWMWSDDILMALDPREALAMRTRTIGGREYLFFEKGGFSANHPKGWMSPLYVLARQ